MATVLALYNAPANPAAFDAYYASTHTPLAKTLPGLRSYEVSHGVVMTPGGPAPHYLVAMLKFDSMAAIQAALGSPAGQAVVADLGNFASSGVSIMMFDDKPA